MPLTGRVARHARSWIAVRIERAKNDERGSRGDADPQSNARAHCNRLLEHLAEYVAEHHHASKRKKGEEHKEMGVRHHPFTVQDGPEPVEAAKLRWLYSVEQ